MAMSFSWKEVDDVEEFTLIPEGKYIAKIINAELKETTKGDEYLNIELQVQDEKYMKNRIFDRIFYHTEGTRKRAKYFFKKIGLEEIIKKNKMPTIMQIAGVPCFGIKVEHEEYQGKKNAKPGFYGYYRKDELEEEETKPSDDNMGEPPF